MTQDAIIATLILGAMCFAMWFLARLARQRMGIGAGTVLPGALRVVGKRPLDQRSALWVVEVAGRHILLGSGTDGTVTKLDDISPEEYARMVAEPEGGPRMLRQVVGGGPAAAAAPVAPGSEADGVDATASDAEIPAEQRFATVGESFQMLLGKARSRRNDRASGE